MTERRSGSNLLRALAAVVTLTVLAAACGDDTGTPDATADESTTTTEAAPDPADDTGDTTTTTTTEAPELFASAPGVTAETIRIGIAYIDLETVAALVDLDHGSYEAAYRAIIDDVNANGGVLGRMIEPVFAALNPLDAEANAAACVRLTEDEEVFAIFGNVQGPDLPCYIELGSSPFLGSVPTDELVARAQVPWFSVTKNLDESSRIMVQGFIDRGIFDGATVGVIAPVDDERVMDEAVIPTLQAAGIEPAEDAVVTTNLVFVDALEAEVQLIAERFSAAGVDVVLGVGAGGLMWAGGVEDITFRPRLATTQLSSLRVYIRDAAGRDLTVLQDAVAGNQAEQIEWWTDDGLQDCIGIVEAAGEPEIIDPNVRLEGEPENIVSVNAACWQVNLFVAIAEAAGVELNVASFEQAGLNLGEQHVPGYGVGSFTPETPDGDFPIFYYEWDDEAQDLVNNGETF